MNKVGIITQARMSSTRLPGKVLLPAGNRTMLSLHLSRLQKTGFPVIVATTTGNGDDPIVRAALQDSVAVFRGDENNVLERYLGAADQSKFDVIVRVTSDCPLIDGTIIKEGVERFLSLNDSEAFVSNTLDRTFPRGMDFEVFSVGALREANANAKTKVEREHVTPYLYSTTSAARQLVQILREDDASEYRLTLDTSEDYELLSSLIVNHGAAYLGCQEIVELLRSNPKLVAINNRINQKALGE